MTPEIIRSWISRRSVVRASAPFLLFGMAATTARAARLSQKAVAYQDSPKGNERCDNCKYFQPPVGCTKVEWPISANGWCHIWVKQD